MKLQQLLSFSRFYQAFTAIIGAHAYRQRMVRDYVRPKPGCRILDIGCGPADILDHLEDLDYTGFDVSADYIETAKSRHGHRARFVCAAVGDTHTIETGAFDRVLALGVVHHLDDREADAMFSLAARALKPDGHLLTLDGCFTPDQTRVEAFLLRHDRGKHVRNHAAYRALAGTHFQEVRSEIHHQLLNIPYTHLIMECRRNPPAG